MTVFTLVISAPALNCLVIQINSNFKYQIANEIIKLKC